LFLNVSYVLLFNLFRVILNVCLCTGNFVMVLLKLDPICILATFVLWTSLQFIKENCKITFNFESSTCSNSNLSSVLVLFSLYFIQIVFNLAIKGRLSGVEISNASNKPQFVCFSRKTHVISSLDPVCVIPLELSYMLNCVIMFNVSNLKEHKKTQVISIYFKLTDCKP